MELNTILKNIVLNEISYNVTLLHKALEALGLPVAGNEVDEGKAGEDTLKRVRTLQMKLNVPFDESTLMNEATALAITDSLNKLGLTASSSSFTVTDAVKLHNVEVKKRQQLIAFDLDLRGVAVYRTVKTIEDIKKRRGFEFLGQSVSDNKGNYSITFYDWQYRQLQEEAMGNGLHYLMKINGGKIMGIKDCIDVKFSEGRGIFDRQCWYPVIDDQEEQQLKVGGTVDDITANAINTLLLKLGQLEPESQKTLVVSGQVIREDGLPFEGGLVQAFHEIEGSVIRLGEDKPDAKGRYTIRYELLPGVDSINLSISVKDEDGHLLQSSDVIRGAKQLEIVDLVVPRVDLVTFQVKGKVASGVSAGVSGLRAKIMDKTVGDDVQLAEAVTDDGGAYRATFTDADLRRRGKQLPDLQARAFAGETFVGASDVRYNSSNRETLNVLLDEKASSALRSGRINPSEVPIDYIVRGRNTLILNTRSAQALTRAGIPRSQWAAVNRTGQAAYEARLTGQLARNRLTNEGMPNVRESGGR